MIVGVKGLDKQLLFIKDYYPQGKDIIIFHDDIASIFKKVSPQSAKEINLNKFFKYAFKTARKLNLTLWGVNRVSNPFFMTDGYTTDLRLIDGFWKTFKKQSPTVSALFVLGNGDIVVGDSNTSGAVREDCIDIVGTVVVRTTLLGIKLSQITTKLIASTADIPPNRICNNNVVTGRGP
jgi:hypothetical protein